MTKLTAILLSLFLLILAGNAYSQDMNPEAGILYNKGNGLLKAGNYNGAIENYEKALEFYNKALELNPENIEIKKSLEELKN